MKIITEFSINIPTLMCWGYNIYSIYLEWCLNVTQNEHNIKNTEKKKTDKFYHVCKSLKKKLLENILLCYFYLNFNHYNFNLCFFFSFLIIIFCFSLH
jgi:hypothetical protein